MLRVNRITVTAVLLAAWLAPSLAAEKENTIRVILQNPPTLEGVDKMAVSIGYGYPNDDPPTKLAIPFRSWPFHEKEFDHTGKSVQVDLEIPDLKELNKSAEAVKYKLKHTHLTIHLTSSQVGNGGGWCAVPIEARPGGTITVAYKSKVVPFEGSNSVTFLSITDCVETYLSMDKELKYVQVKESPAIKVAEGASEVKKEEYTTRHSIGVQKGAKLDLEVKGRWVMIEAGIKGQIELATSRTIEESSTSSREVTIPGNGKTYKLVWLEAYRTGTGTTIINGKKFEVPFEFRDGWDLRTKEVKK